MIKLKDSRETIGASPFCKHVGSRLLPNAPNILNCGLVLKLARYRVSCALEASLNIILLGSVLPIKVISVDCNRNLHHLITYKFPHFIFLW